VNGVFVPPGSTHYTLLSVPYSFEPDYVWVVADPGGAASVPGIRVVNALWDSVPIEVAADGHALGELEWANAPTSYLDISPFTGSDHLNQVVISDTSFALSRTLSWASWDLVSMASVTIYLSGALEFYPATGLACFDSQPDTGGPLSNCWPVESP
jgi:hypothetical protein